MSPKLYPHIVNFVKTLEGVDPCVTSGMLEVMDAVPTRIQPSDSAVAATAQAVSNRFARIYETASYVMGALADYDPRALQAIKSLSESPDGRIRHNAILCLTEDTSFYTTIDVIQRGLNDRSSRVRSKAADWCGRLNLIQALPDIRSAFEHEKNAGTCSVMEWAIEKLESLPTGQNFKGA